MVNNILLLSIIIFITTLSFLLSQIFGFSFAFFSPLTVAGILLAIGSAIALGNTPVLKGGAIAVASVLIFSGFFLQGDLLSSLGIELFGLIIVPILIVLGFIFIDSGSG